MKTFLSIILFLEALGLHSQNLEVPDFSQLYRIEWVSKGESTVFVLIDGEGWHLFEMEPIKSVKLQTWYEKVDFRRARPSTEKVVGSKLIGELILESKSSDNQHVIGVYLKPNGTYLALVAGTSKTYLLPSVMVENIRAIEKLYGDGE